jgi:hypothetical protein
MRFPQATNLNGPWHQATTWLREHYVERVGVPILAVLHAPFLAGSDGSVHIHGLVLMRKATCFEWLGIHRDLAEDAGLAAAEASWKEMDCCVRFVAGRGHPHLATAYEREDPSRYVDFAPQNEYRERHSRECSRCIGRIGKR